MNDFYILPTVEKPVTGGRERGRAKQHGTSFKKATPARNRAARCLWARV
jgi:hypothetical protein